MDWVGFMGNTGAAVSLTLVLTFGGSTWGWNEGRTIALFVVAGALFVLIFAQQYFAFLTTSEARMFPPRHIFLNKTQVLLNIVTAMGANVYGYSIILGDGTGLVFNLGFAVSGVTIMAETVNGIDLQRVISMQSLSQLGFQTLSLLIGGQIFQSLSFKNLSRVLGDMGLSNEEIRSGIAGIRSVLF